MSIDRNHRNVYCNQSDGVIATFLPDKTALPCLIVLRVRCSMSTWTGANNDRNLLHNSRVCYVLLLETRSGKRNGDVYMKTWPFLDAASFVRTSSELKEGGFRVILKEREIEWKRVRAMVRDREGWRVLCKPSTPTGRRASTEWCGVKIYSPR
jgi:hypothetical protein